MGDFLDKLKQSSAMSSIMGKPRSVLGVDIGSSTVKVVQLGEKKGRAVLENYAELALGPYAGLEVGQAANLSKAKLKEALGDIFREANITERRAAISIPMGSTLLSLIELPKVDNKRLKTMVPIEARKYIPVPISEVMLDYWVLPERKRVDTDNDETTVAEERLEVLIAAIHKDTLAKYREIKKGSELTTNMFEIDIFSVIRSVVGRDDSLIMVVDIGAGTTKIAIVEFGILRMQHIINMGSQDITATIAKTHGLSLSDAENLKREQGLSGQYNGQPLAPAINLSLGHIIAQIEKVIAGHRKRSRRNVGKVILAGGGAMLKGLTETMGEQLGIEVVVGQPFARVQTPIFLDNTLREAGPEFSVAVGLGIKGLQE